MVLLCVCVCGLIFYFFYSTLVLFSAWSKSISPLCIAWHITCVGVYVCYDWCQHLPFSPLQALKTFACKIGQAVWFDCRLICVDVVQTHLTETSALCKDEWFWCDSWRFYSIRDSGVVKQQNVARATVLFSWMKGAIIVWGLLNVLMCWNSHLWSASTVQVYYLNLIGEYEWVHVFKSSPDQVEQTQFNWVGKCCPAFL